MINTPLCANADCPWRSACRRYNDELDPAYGVWQTSEHYSPNDDGTPCAAYEEWSATDDTPE